MFLYSNLLDAVSEKTIDVVSWISLGAIAVLIIAMVCLCVFTKKVSASEVANAGICIAASFALSFIKVSPLLYGGSITLASFVPLLIYSYKFGPIKGLLAGFIFGLLNFVSDPYILTPMSFVLDYLLAFASIGIMGIAPKLGNLPVTAKVAIGTVLVYVLRFIFHLLSGIIYFNENAIWVSLPDWALSNAFVYSFIYQCVYIPADCVISLVVLIILSQTKTLDRLLAIMGKHDKKNPAPDPDDGDQNA